jgi:hypothetical protein
MNAQHVVCQFSLLIGVTLLLGFEAGEGDGKWPPVKGQLLELKKEESRWKLTIQNPKNKDEKRSFYLEKDVKIFVVTGTKDDMKKMEMGHEEAGDFFKEDIEKGKVLAQVILNVKDDKTVQGVLISKSAKKPK